MAAPAPVKEEKGTVHPDIIDWLVRRVLEEMKKGGPIS